MLQVRRNTSEGSKFDPNVEAPEWQVKRVNGLVFIGLDIHF